MIVGECHPSTSDAAAGNDIVLATVGGQVRVRSEVCDVTTAKVGAGQRATAGGDSADEPPTPAFTLAPAARSARSRERASAGPGPEDPSVT